jgi:hypothetical protein
LKGGHLPKVRVNLETHVALVEENWWEGIHDFEKVDVHCFVYRADCGPRAGQFCAQAHIHRPGGGKVLLQGGLPDLSKYSWAATRDDAVNQAIKLLEARDISEIR